MTSRTRQARAAVKQRHPSAARKRTARGQPVAKGLPTTLEAALDAIESLRQESLRQLARVQALRVAALATEQRRPDEALGRTEAQVRSMVRKLKQLERLVLKVDAKIKKADAGPRHR
jgi:hypothetical protein